MPADSVQLEMVLEENKKLREENAYLSFLVWKLSARELATQHSKYECWLRRTYVSTREADFGVNDAL